MRAGERGQVLADATGTGDPAPGHRPGDAGSAHRPACQEDKRLLQVASVGKDVPFTSLQAVAELPDAALRRGLDHLQAAAFVYETGLFPDLKYASDALWRAIAGMGMTEGVLGGHALRTRLPLQVREHTHSAFHMLRGHNDDFGADAVEFQIDAGVIERHVAYAE